jgi:hypothetical protein
LKCRTQSYRSHRRAGHIGVGTLGGKDTLSCRIKGHRFAGHSHTGHTCMKDTHA